MTFIWRTFHFCISGYADKRMLHFLHSVSKPENSSGGVLRTHDQKNIGEQEERERERLWREGEQNAVIQSESKGDCLSD